ncbi:uncharacterized [Tachysurus ichikawai]
MLLAQTWNLQSDLQNASCALGFMTHTKNGNYLPVRMKTLSLDVRRSSDNYGKKVRISLESNRGGSGCRSYLGAYFWCGAYLQCHRDEMAQGGFASKKDPQRKDRERDEIYIQTQLKQSAKTMCRTYSLTAINKPSRLSKTAAESQGHRASIHYPTSIQFGDVVNFERSHSPEVYMMSPEV